VSESAHQCPLCGIDFAVPACHSCPLARDCKLIRCPRCSYEFAEESSVVDFVRRLFSWRSHVPPTV